MPIDSYTFAKPMTLSIPAWATVDVLKSETFDINAARALSAAHTGHHTQYNISTSRTRILLGILLPCTGIFIIILFLRSSSRHRSRSHSSTSLLHGRSGYTLIDEPGVPRRNKHRAKNSSLSILIRRTADLPRP